MSKIDSSPSHGQILQSVTAVIANYLKKNPVSASALPAVIHSVYNALVGTRSVVVSVVEDRPDPAVSIKKSITPDYIICLEDGKKLKMLKRHLSTAYGLTPDTYRQRWGLPPDYPMVAPNYAAQRSSLAKQIGLGSRSRIVVVKPPARGRARKGEAA